jgi:hypothetical protein
MDRRAFANRRHAFSTSTGSSPKLPAISAQAASKASLVDFKASGPNDTPSMSCRAFVVVIVVRRPPCALGHSPTPTLRSWHGGRHGLADRPAALAGGHAFDRLGLLMLGELGLAAELGASLAAAALPSFARLTMRWRSSSASALRKAMKPRPSGVVTSRRGLSSTLIRRRPPPASTSSASSLSWATPTRWATRPSMLTRRSRCGRMPATAAPRWPSASSRRWR